MFSFPDSQTLKAHPYSFHGLFLLFSIIVIDFIFSFFFPTLKLLSYPFPCLLFVLFYNCTPFLLSFSSKSSNLTLFSVASLFFPALGLHFCFLVIVFISSIFSLFITIWLIYSFIASISSLFFLSLFILFSLFLVSSAQERHDSSCLLFLCIYVRVSISLTYSIFI